MLASLSDAELSVRAKGGDLNAKTHEAMRSAKQAFASAEKLDKRQVTEAGDLVGFSLRWSGPYGASKVLELSSELVEAYYSVPESERSEAKRQVMAGIYVYREAALGLSIAYGDHTHDVLWGQSLSPLDKTLPGQKEMDGRSIGYALARASEDRQRMGLGPVVLTPRPIPEEVVKRGYAAYRELQFALERE